MKPQNVIHILMAIVCFALLPQTRAVDPPHTPDPPPLPISNTADGDLALLGVTGIYNSAFGIYALLSNGAANFNTGVGADVLLVNTADENTGVGAATLFSNTAGINNTGDGAFALFSNTTGLDNTAVGNRAMQSNIDGSRHTAVGSHALFNCIAPPDVAGNTAVGTSALFSDTIGNFNTAMGDGALFSNTEGSDNTANGVSALAMNTEGGANTAIGRDALFSNTTGDQNTALGASALRSNTDGFQNTAIGLAALFSDTTGELNTAVGVDALKDNTEGQSNAAIGKFALTHNTIGNFNTAMGTGALSNNTTGDGNTVLGSSAGGNVTTADGVTCIGFGAAGANVDDTTWIATVYGVTTQSGTTAPVIVSDNGQLGTLASSERFKKDIATMEKTSEAILSLRPVTFHYKTDTQGTPQFGLIAEEVAKVNPALVLPDKEGKPYTVRYDAVNAMLLNEFLKQHRKNEEQEKTIAELKSGMTALATTVKEQASQIQKVSAQLEASKPAQQVVNNP